MYPITRHLSEKIGPRPAGSPGEYEAARYLCGLFEKLGLKPRLQPFHFINWTPIGWPKLEILSPERMEIPVAPMAFTLPTPASGVEGTVKKIGVTLMQFGNIKRQKYVLVDDSGEEVGYFLKGGNQAASTFPSGAPLIQMPGVIMGARDADEKIERLLAEGKKIRARITSRCVQEMATSQNIVVPVGEGAPRMVICAHYDGVYGSPAAVDNASGVEALLNIAEKLVKRTDLPPFLFVCFGCEELKFNGSTHFVKDLQEHDRLESIQYVVNLDMIGHGTDITIGTGNGMEAFTNRLIEKYAGAFTSKLVPGDVKPTSDHWAFHESGIATVQLTGSPFSDYHQDLDTTACMEETIMRETETFAADLIDLLFADLGANG